MPRPNNRAGPHLARGIQQAAIPMRRKDVFYYCESIRAFSMTDQ